MEEKSMTPEQRAAFVRRAMDGWNTNMSYWDRKMKYAKMAVNPYAFYRGTAQLYWHDFGQDGRLEQFGGTLETATMVTGDGHAYNIGSFYDGDQVVYGLNDFDEGIVADYQLDLWRLAISMVLLFRANDNNITLNDQNEVIDSLSHEYLLAMRTFMDRPETITKPLTTKDTKGKMDEFLTIVVNKNSRKDMLDKWAPTKKEDSDNSSRRFDLSNKKMGSVTAHEKRAILDAMGGYWTTLSFVDGVNPDAVDPTKAQIIDVCRRLKAGTGSLGTDRYYLLLLDGSGVTRILDIKEQPQPAGYAYGGTMVQAKYEEQTWGNHALGVAEAHRALRVTKPDPFMGWMQLNGNYFSVMERSPWKGSYPALTDEAKKKYKHLKLDSKERYVELAECWAWGFASPHAHAKKGLDNNIVTRVGDQVDAFVNLVRTIAFEYADQVEADWEAFTSGLGADIKD